MAGKHANTLEYASSKFSVPSAPQRESGFSAAKIAVTSASSHDKRQLLERNGEGSLTGLKRVFTEKSSQVIAR
jgi:hypothetical protein